MKIAAIVDIRGHLKCEIITLPFIPDDDRLFEIVDAKIKRDLDTDGLVLDIYRNVGYARINNRDCKSMDIIRADAIFDVVCMTLELNDDKVHQPWRVRKYADGRSIIAYHMHDNTNLTLSDIGGYMGGRHHSTVINMLRRYNNLNEVDAGFQEKASAVQKKIKDHPLFRKRCG